MEFHFYARTIELPGLVEHIVWIALTALPNVMHVVFDAALAPPLLRTSDNSD
jgi:hypothetical protein